MEPQVEFGKFHIIHKLHNSLQSVQSLSESGTKRDIELLGQLKPTQQLNRSQLTLLSKKTTQSIVNEQFIEIHTIWLRCLLCEVSRQQWIEKRIENNLVSIGAQAQGCVILRRSVQYLNTLAIDIRCYEVKQLDDLYVHAITIQHGPMKKCKSNHKFALYANPDNGRHV